MKCKDRADKCLCKNFFRAAYMRLLLPLVIVFLDFVIYAEDPIQDSRTEATLPVVGNVLNFLGFVFSERPGFGVLIALGGIVTGKFFHRLVLQGLFGISAFTPKNGFVDKDFANDIWSCKGKCMYRKLTGTKPDRRIDDGSFLVIALSTVLWFFAASVSWAESQEGYRNSPTFGLTNAEFGKVAQSLTWVGDLITIVMVWDSILQKPGNTVGEMNSPNASKRQDYCSDNTCSNLRESYNKCRIPLSIVFVLASTAIVWTLIWTAPVSREEVPFHLLSSVLARTIWVLLIFLVDVSIVVQDWDFPEFEELGEVKVACLETTQVKCCSDDCCANRDFLRSFCSIKISAKWLTYGPLMVILALDLNMLKNQLVYVPEDFGQYVKGGSGAIFTIRDETYLGQFYDEDGIYGGSGVTAASRVNSTTDFPSLSNWDSEGVDALPLALALSTAAVAVFSITFFGGCLSCFKCCDATECACKPNSLTVKNLDGAEYVRASQDVET